MNLEQASLAAQWLQESSEHGSKGLRLFLNQCQMTFNWVGPECLELASSHFQMSISEIKEMALLGGQVSLEPQGEIVIEVCRGLACSDAHSADVLENAEKTIGIKDGQTSPDGRFTLKKHYCFGRCAIGPNVQINQDFHVNQTPAILQKTIESLKKSS